MYFQFTSILELTHKSRWTAVAKPTTENLKLKRIRSEQMHNIFEKRVQFVEEGAKYDGKRKKRME